jgi:tetratricopeptide (TPR) repeat protein
MRKLAAIIALLMFAAGTTLAQDSSQAQVLAPEIYQRAGQAFNSQDYQKAITDYSLFILLNPTFSMAYYDRGQSYIQLNDLDAALADFTRALELPSPSPQFTAGVYWLRSAILFEQSKIEDALADLDQAIVVAPREAEGYFRRGQIYAAQERYEEALEDFNQGITLAPNVPNLYELRGQVHQQLENYDAAVTDFSSAIELDPNNARVYSERAAVREQQGQFDTALKDLNTAIQLQPDSSGLYLQRGALHNKMENLESAAADYFQWVINVATDETSGLRLRPGESQVVQMRQGLIYTLGFEGRAGQTISVSAVARPGRSTDPLLVILDPDQNPLAADDDSGGFFNAVIRDFVLPKDGVYLVVLGHAGGGSDGPVRVLLTVAH